jgi:glutamate dehydrogenase
MQRFLDNNIQNNLICENPSYRKHIVDKAIGNSSSQIFKDFVHKFYAYLPVDYMDPSMEETFSLIAKDSFEFTKERKKDEVKIEFMKDGQKKYGGSTLRIVVPNKLFTIDAVKYVFKKYDVRTKICLHPLIGIKRDSKGLIDQVLDSTSEITHQDESIIFAILGEIPGKTQELIIEECRTNLEKVSLLDESSHKIYKKMSEIIKKNECSPDDTKFLKWAHANNFTFLASLDFDEFGNLNNFLGDKSIIEEDIAYIQDVVKKAIAAQDDGLMLDKMSEISPLNSGRCIDYILVQKQDRGSIFFGFYTTNLQSQSVQNIPILSGKLSYVLERSGFKVNSYNYRKLLAIAESFPRDALFQINSEDLYCICLHILSAMLARSLKLFIQKDSSGEFLNVLVFMPIERLKPETHLAIIKYLTSKFETKVITDEITDVSNSFCYL